MMTMRAVLAASLPAIGSNAADIRYQKPPKAVLDVFNAPPFPVAVPNPSGDTLLLATPVPYPPIADLAKPMLRLAGLRIDPTTNGDPPPPFSPALSPNKIPAGA